MEFQVFTLGLEVGWLQLYDLALARRTFIVDCSTIIVCGSAGLSALKFSLALTDDSRSVHTFHPSPTAR